MTAPADFLTDGLKGQGSTLYGDVSERALSEYSDDITADYVADIGREFSKQRSVELAPSAHR